MNYRALDLNGDYQFGRAGTFLENSSAAVAQAIMTRLNLWSGEWFLDSDEGTPYNTRILGYATQGTRDVELKSRIVDTPGVRELLTYNSSVNDHMLTVTATVSTDYGAATINFQA